MDLTALKAHIRATPHLRALADQGNHAGIASAYLEPVPGATAWQPVPRKTFTAWCARSGLWTACRRVCLTPITEQTPGPVLDLIAAAQTVLDLHADLLDWLDLRLPIIQQMAEGFRAAGLLTAEQKVELLGLGERPALLWEVAGLPSQPTLGQVSAALNEVR